MEGIEDLIEECENGPDKGILDILYGSNEDSESIDGLDELEMGTVDDTQGAGMDFPLSFVFYPLPHFSTTNPCSSSYLLLFIFHRKYSQTCYAQSRRR